MDRIEIPKRKSDEETFERLLRDFMSIYEKTYGKPISKEEVLEILENERTVEPITLKVAEALERLFEVYHRLKHH